MKRFFSFLLLLFLLGCEKKQAETTVFSGSAMTMDYHITLGHKMKPKEIEIIVGKIDEIFQFVDTTFNKFNPESELSKLNLLPVGEKMKLSCALYDLLQLCFSIHNATLKRFDPSIEGFQRKIKPRLIRNEEFDIVQASLQDTGFSNLILENGFATKKTPILLDLCAIAKGVAVDLIVEGLEKLGYKNLLVSWAGEVKATGKHPANRPWQVALTSNKKKLDRALKIPLQNEAIATSGDHHQHWKIGDKVYSHIFNPFTKMPLQVAIGKLTNVSVIAEQCAVADALATAIMTAEDQETLDKLLDHIKLYYPKVQFWIMKRKEEAR